MRKLRSAAVIGAVSAVALFAGTSNAYAAGHNWADQIGVNGYGCFAWTTWSQNMVTPHIYQQPNNYGDTCHLQVQHAGYNAGHQETYQNWWPTPGDPDAFASTSGPGTVVDGPSWYYGPWTSGQMCVYIVTYDDLDQQNDLKDFGTTQYCP